MKATLKRIVNDIAAIGWTYRTFRAFGNGRTESASKALQAVVDGGPIDLFPEGEDPGPRDHGTPKAKLIVVNKRDINTVN